MNSREVESKRKSNLFVLHEPKSSKSHLKQPLLNPVDVDDDDDISQPWLGSSKPSSSAPMSMSLARIDDEFGNKQGTIGHEELHAMKCPVWCCF